MALKFQYNKTALQQLRRQLDMRLRALPTLKSKETALRVAVKKAAEKVEESTRALEKASGHAAHYDAFWLEFPPVLRVEKVHTYQVNVLGARLTEVERVEFSGENLGLFGQPAWYPAAYQLLKTLIELEVSLKAKRQQLVILQQMRKKTTQKVNLYEKVQIPAFEAAIRKIKGYMEDKENIAKASQKMLIERMRKKQNSL